MSLRSTLWLGLLACTAACDSALSDAAFTAADLPPRVSDSGAQIEIDGEDELVVVVRNQVALRVRYVDSAGSPLANQSVEFGLSGSAEGASLLKASVRTGSDGIAETTLMAGSTVSTFQVRASALDAAPAYFDVRVIQAARPTLTLNLVYEGARTLESRRFSVVSDMTCDQLRNRSAEAVRVAYVLGAAEQEIAYQETLVPGGRYVAFAWGSDDTNSTLATGCLAFEAPAMERAEDAALALTVKLQDLPFTLAPSYDVTLGLDLSSPLADLAKRTQQSVQEALPETSTPEASYLLDLLGGKVNSSARTSLGLDAELAVLLKQNVAGPQAYFDALTASLTEESLSSSLEGRLVPGTAASAAHFELTRMVSMRGGKSARELDLSTLRAGPELRASYDDARAALKIDALSIPLGFGRFALALLDVVSGLPDAYGAAPSVRDGCQQLAQLVSQRPAAFPGLTALEAVATCDDGVASLLAKVRAEWSDLDDGGASLQLGGAVFVHDRDSNGEVDDLGPSPLPGSWTGAHGKSSVSATLRVTPKQTLTI